MAKTKKAVKKTAKKVTAKSGNPLETFEHIRDQAAQMEGELLKFDQGIKAAGRRARKAAQEIKKLCSQLRKEITEQVKEM